MNEIENIDKDTNFSKQVYFMLLLIVVVTTAVVLKTISSVVLPIIFAVLLGFVFMPIVRKMQKKIHIPWSIGSILVTLLSVVIFFALSSLLMTSLTTIVSQYPKYEKRFMTIYRIFAETLNLEIDEGKSFFQNIWGVEKVRTYVQNFTIALSTRIVTLGKSFFMVFLLLPFFLIELQLTNKKLTAAFKQNPTKRKKIYRLSLSIGDEITRFLSIKFFISLLTGIIVFAGTFLMKIDFPIVWGFLAFIMNFIPTFGSIISGFLTTLFALLQFYPSYWQTIVTAILMIGVNITLGNVIEPKIEGEHLGLSPFVILISLSLWGYIWGFLGMLVAVPMTVIIKIICENVSYLNFFAVMLGSNTNYSAENPHRHDIFSIKKRKK